MKFMIPMLMMIAMTSPLRAADLVNVAGASRIAITGYDPVAFFADGKAVNGSPFITAEHQGAVYLFASEEHKKMFTATPNKYAPQYGGFCAYGVALGRLFPVDINTWQVREGKLYLNLNAEILKEFNADFSGHITKADQNWPGIVKANAR
jgi:YHS domain-containing protein